MENCQSPSPNLLVRSLFSITGNGPGGNAAAVVNQMNLKVYVGAGEMTLKEAYDSYKNGLLKTV